MNSNLRNLISILTIFFLLKNQHVNGKWCAFEANLNYELGLLCQNYTDSVNRVEFTVIYNSFDKKDILQIDHPNKKYINFAKTFSVGSYRSFSINVTVYHHCHAIIGKGNGIKRLTFQIPDGCIYCPSEDNVKCGSSKDLTGF
uniref:ZP domain-containing protein n=1 Tax=Parastrongyloides trichosuri TaxID=131310 RepID=A0A0N5A6V4_PARTI